MKLNYDKKITLAAIIVRQLTQLVSLTLILFYLNSQDKVFFLALTLFASTLSRLDFGIGATTFKLLEIQKGKSTFDKNILRRSNWYLVASLFSVAVVMIITIFAGVSPLIKSDNELAFTLIYTLSIMSSILYDRQLKISCSLNGVASARNLDILKHTVLASVVVFFIWIELFSMSVYFEATLALNFVFSIVLGLRSRMKISNLPCLLVHEESEPKRPLLELKGAASVLASILNLYIVVENIASNQAQPDLSVAALLGYKIFNILNGSFSNMQLLNVHVFSMKESITFQTWARLAKVTALIVMLGSVFFVLYVRYSIESGVELGHLLLLAFLLSLRTAAHFYSSTLITFCNAHSNFSQWKVAIVEIVVGIVTGYALYTTDLGQSIFLIVIYSVFNSGLIGLAMSHWIYRKLKE